jgi:hypothetical protein
MTYRVLEDFVSGDTFDALSSSIVAADRVIIKFDNAPNVNDFIQVHLFNTPAVTKSYSEIASVRYTVQASDVGNSLGCVITMPHSIEYYQPWEPNVNVMVNRQYLEPSNQAYYIGDGATKIFSLPEKRNIPNISLIQESDIVVVVDNVTKNKGSDYSITNNGVDIPKVTFVNAPSRDSNVVISDRSQAEYVIHNKDTVIIKPTFTVSEGDEVVVILYSNHDRYDTRTEVLSGEVTETTSVFLGFDEIGFDIQGFEIEKTNLLITPIYTLNRPITNMNNVIVTLNGVRLTPYYDFSFSTPVTLRIDPDFNVGTDDIIVVTHINESKRELPLEFRIFKGITETYEYHKISYNTTTTLTQDLLIDDDWIYVRDVNVLSQPDPVHSSPGVIFINGERITFYIVDIVNKRLGQLRRSTNGTGGASVHAVGTHVYDAGFQVEIPDARDSYTSVTNETILIGKKGDEVTIPAGSLIRQGQLWYDISDSSATNGLGLENSTSIQVNFLKAV